MIKRYFFLIFLLFAMNSYASLIITGTRIIYPATQKNVSVQISNVGELPALMQVWIDNGDSRALPEEIKTPFVLTPPISRIEANKGQTLRLTYTGEPLPNDRESLFYFNVLEIPPKPNGETVSENYLQIAVRSRIKLFFRPQHLPFAADDAYAKVQWRLEGETTLVADNPTPYFITYTDVYLSQNGQKIGVKETGMVAPFAQLKFQLVKKAATKATVNWKVINDYGARPTGTSALK